jgi:eukaryotic-like serine/threonine-protein kinase
MGEVYRARDNKLDREVAIKVLPPALAIDPERLARFEREARVLATLNHANIAAIYGMEDSGESRALILELVEGFTLADRILSGPIPVAEAIAIAKQIGNALEAAHERGIVHRDLKPSNVVLRHDGVVKVLDFGLAKLMAGPEHDDDESARAKKSSQPPAPTVPAMLTGTGVVLGTSAYMAPEQFKGQPADKRSDIWAFGCVLFEMLAGRRTFESHDGTNTIELVLTKNPDWSALGSDVPSPIRTLLERCLERDRRTRIGDVAAIRFVLEELQGLSGSDPSPIEKRRYGATRRRTVAMIAAAVAIAALAAIAGNRLRPPRTANSFAFSIVPPEGAMFVVPSQGGAPAVSPDGRQIAYVADSKVGRLLWVQSLGAFDARPLAGTENAACPFWSPDNSWLGFSADAELKRVNVTGGSPQGLGPMGRNARVCLGGSATASGTVLFSGALNNTLASVSVSGGEPVAATERNIALFDENHMAPAFLPDGRHYLLHVRGGPDLQFQVWIGSLGSNERQLLLSDVTNARYAAAASSGPGYLLYVRGRTLVAHRFDVSSMALMGAPITLADGIATGGAGALGDFDVSSTVLAYRRGEFGTKELVSYDRAGKEAGSWGDRPGNPRNNVRISPDGRSAAFTRMGDAAQDVWIVDLESRAVSRFTLNGGRSPVWSPDGSEIVYLHGDTLYRKPLKGGRPEVALWNGPGTLAVNDWSGDGKYLLLTRWDPSKPGVTGRGLWLLPDPLDDGASHEPVFLEAPALHGQFGPKVGQPRWVAYDSLQVFVRAMPDRPPSKWQVSETGGLAPRWRADGRELFFVGGATMMSAEIDPNDAGRPAALQRLFDVNASFGAATGQYAAGWDVTPDGRHFLTTQPTPDEPASAITVVMNWQSLLK